MNILSTKDTLGLVPKSRFEAASADKLRGGYYTPKLVAEWLANWAIRDTNAKILEPSAGDGAFLHASVTRLTTLGAASSNVARNLIGVELLPSEIEVAIARLRPLLGDMAKEVVVEGDFFSWLSGHTELFDVVLGNPPFIRYQTFPEPHRSSAMTLMHASGLKPNKLTNIWVPFVVAASERLRVGGRLAMVIPAELLQVTYAAQLRNYLTDRFSHIDVVTCNELFFAGAEQEVVLLLADGARTRGGAASCRVAFTEVRTMSEIVNTSPANVLGLAEEKDVRGDTEKWLKYFLTNSEIGLMRELRRQHAVVNLSELADVDVGIVTGANEFFVVRESDVSSRNLGGVVRATISRSSHIRGAVLSREDWAELAAKNERVHLVDIRVGPDGVSNAAAAYVNEGEAKGFHSGYKCSIRKPWFHVPSMWSPDAFLFRQIHDFPRFVLNSADAMATDTIHRVRVKQGTSAPQLTAAAYTYLTAASSEIEGRSYGGGVLELEPTEAERLLFPASSALQFAMPLIEADRLIKAGRLSDVLEYNGKSLLSGGVGLSAREVDALAGIWKKMSGRRRSRGKRPKPSQLSDSGSTV